MRFKHRIYPIEMKFFMLENSGDRQVIELKPCNGDPRCTVNIVIIKNIWVSTLTAGHQKKAQSHYNKTRQHH